MLKENERIDDLQYKGLKIIQNKDVFCFGIDSVLISDFAKKIKKGAKVIDLGTGNGIIPILLCAKTQLDSIIGVEIQPDIAELAKRNSTLNQLEGKFEVLNKDIKDIIDILPNQSFDAIVSNPPYKKLNTGIVNENKNKLIARHEITANLEDFIFVASRLLKDKASFYLVHRPDRLVDLMVLLRSYKLEPKRLRMVYSSVNREPKLILIEAVKNGRPFLKVDKPLYIYEENGEYTKEILEIYHKEEKI